MCAASILMKSSHPVRGRDVARRRRSQRRLLLPPVVGRGTVRRRVEPSACTASWGVKRLLSVQPTWYSPTQHGRGAVRTWVGWERRWACSTRAAASASSPTGLVAAPGSARTRRPARTRLIMWLPRRCSEHGAHWLENGVSSSTVSTAACSAVTHAARQASTPLPQTEPDT